MRGRSIEKVNREQGHTYSKHGESRKAWSKLHGKLHVELWLPAFEWPAIQPLCIENHCSDQPNGAIVLWFPHAQPLYRQLEQPAWSCS
jgi:hypothetical protein